jgi:conjugal transfer/entry exclusion protein
MQPIEARRRRQAWQFIGVLVTLLLLTSLLTALAQIPLLPGPGEPVYDQANHLQNTITAVQAVAMVANQIIDLTGMADFVLDERGSAEWLGFVVNMACHPPSFMLSFRLGSICGQFERLFPPKDRLPRTGEEYRLWQEEKEEQIRTSAATAMRAQALIELLGRDSESLVGLLRQIQGVIGNLQGIQVHQQLSAQSNALQLRLQAIHATFQRAVTLKLVDDATTIGSLRRINESIMEGHPR